MSNAPPVKIRSEPGRYGESYAVVLKSSDVGVDLSLTTGVTLRARDSAGNEYEWAAAHAWDAEAGELAVTYAFEAGDNDLKRLGPWSVYAEIAHGDGTPWRAEPRPLLVIDRFAVV